ncbi:MAG: hypothetical protein OXG15_02245 [Gammaproteobacteria bacterium]|nr:hypothetical protein [Gammaproteobacteria bacterium]
MLKERFLWRYGPHLANLLLQFSTLRTRSLLKGSDPLTVLIDNSVLGHGRTHETVAYSQKVNWPPGGEPCEVPVIHRAPINIKNKYEEEVYDSVRYLPGIAHLTRLGFIQLKTSFELYSERNHQPTGRYEGKKGYFDYWLFDGIKIESVDGYDVPDFDLEHFRKNPRINKVICSTDVDPLGIYPNNKEKQINRVSQSNDPLYLELAKLLPMKSNLDAWHIRTAEAHGLFCFLTMDFKLWRLVEKNKNKEPIASFHTKVMTPKEFGEHIGLWPVNPHICELAERDALKSSARLREKLSADSKAIIRRRLFTPIEQRRRFERSLFRAWPGNRFQEPRRLVKRTRVRLYEEGRDCDLNARTYEDCPAVPLRPKATNPEMILGKGEKGMKCARDFEDES